MNELKYTGERLVAGINAVHGVTEHLHRYAMALQFIKDKVVLDIASGEGYGGFLMSKYAKKVYGVDIDAESINHAKKKYSKCNNLEFVTGSATDIPLKDNCIDVITSFETLEHLVEQDEMLKEITRVLKQDGCLLISSPEKSIYKERDPDNQFHLKELTIDELKSLLSKYFKNNIYFTQRFVFGSLIHFENASSKFELFQGDYNSIDNKLELDEFYNKPFFNLALCSNVDIDFVNLKGNSLFSGLEVLRNEAEKNKIQLDNEKKEKEALMKTTSYRLGTWIVRKFYFLKKKGNKII